MELRWDRKKSQLVQKYIEEHGRQYYTVTWIEAGQKETIERDFVQLYNLPFPPNRNRASTTAPEAIMGVKNCLRSGEGQSLRIMDGVDEALVDPDYYLPEAPWLNRVITTRSSRIRKVGTGNGMAVAGMEETEGDAIIPESCSHATDRCGD